MKNSSIYIRFLNLLEAVEQSPDLAQLDLECKKLLEIVAVRAQASQPLSVTEAMGLDHIASPATIHRKLDQLKELKLIESVHQGDNKRTKYMIPTRKALQYFDRMGKVMIKTLKTPVSR
jgi:hypothetical protein